MDQLLVALDVESGDRALQLADQLRGVAGGYKIGKRLFTLEGPAIVRALVERGDRVFLDLKFHDIPNTVAAAVTAATSLGVWMLNVHASGGRRMMEAARQAAADTAAREGRQAPLVIGVTVLTSMNADALADVGVPVPIMEQVERLARLAQSAGLEGVVASPQEIRMIREACGPDFIIVTPGIRGGAAVVSGKDDQQRTMTAREAIAAGATYIVVGRPIIGSENPRLAASRLQGSQL
ncbi:MAG TPA: orotidine-5'-phosphate decarboxylase [Vicinamibacterales bacterium]|nr:orotidine-5'-phosphate decarboxylase [Vicinamibacterales bacterium]